MSFQQKIDPIHSKFTICFNIDVLKIVLWACFQANVLAILQSMCIKSDSFYSYYLSCTKYFWKYSKFAMPVSAMIFVLYHFSTVIQADHFVVCDKVIPIARFMGPTWGPSGADRTAAIASTWQPVQNLSTALPARGCHALQHLIGWEPSAIKTWWSCRSLGSTCHAYGRKFAVKIQCWWDEKDVNLKMKT